MDAFVACDHEDAEEASEIGGVRKGDQKAGVYDLLYSGCYTVGMRNRLF